MNHKLYECYKEGKKTTNFLVSPSVLPKLNIVESTSKLIERVNLFKANLLKTWIESLHLDEIA